MARKKILWLCSWYPNRVDPFDGDFIRRHARAAALYNDIHVIRVVADPVLNPGRLDVQRVYQASLTEELIYLGKKDSLAGRYLFYRRWNKIFRQTILQYLRDQGEPAVVHIHVPYPAGRMAIWLKKKTGRPFVVTEHWTIYQPGNGYVYAKQPARLRKLVKKVIREAALLLPVSQNLGQLINKLVGRIPVQVVPNVVDTRLFNFSAPGTLQNNHFRFVHVSGMSAQKNPEGLLRAFAAAWLEDPAIQMRVIGNKDQELPVYAATLGLTSPAVLFAGEISYEEVAREMRDSNALVLFSQVENAPCVISEALCCGLPVIATRTGGIPEMLNESNGLLVEPGDETALKVALLDLKKNYNRYNRAAIASKASSIYNYEVVGKELSDLYNQVVSPG